MHVGYASIAITSFGVLAILIAGLCWRTSIHQASVYAMILSLCGFHYSMLTNVGDVGRVLGVHNSMGHLPATMAGQGGIYLIAR